MVWWPVGWSLYSYAFIPDMLLPGQFTLATHDILAVLALSVPCKCLFSSGKQVATDHCSSLGLEWLEEIQVMNMHGRTTSTILQHWTHSRLSIWMSVSSWMGEEIWWPCWCFPWWFLILALLCILLFWFRSHSQLLYTFLVMFLIICSAHSFLYLYSVAFKYFEHNSICSWHNYYDFKSERSFATYQRHTLCTWSFVVFPTSINWLILNLTKLTS